MDEGPWLCRLVETQSSILLELQRQTTVIYVGVTDAIAPSKNKNLNIYKEGVMNKAGEEAAVEKKRYCKLAVAAVLSMQQRPRRRKT